MQRDPKGYVDISNSSSSSSTLQALEDAERRASSKASMDNTTSLTRGNDGKGRALGAERSTSSRSSSSRSSAYFDDDNTDSTRRSSSNDYQLKRNGGEVRSTNSRTQYTPQSSRYSDSSSRRGSTDSSYSSRSSRDYDSYSRSSRDYDKSSRSSRDYETSSRSSRNGSGYDYSQGRSKNEVALRERGDVARSQGRNQYPASSRYGDDYGYSSNRNRNKKKKSGGFKKFIIIFSAVLLVILIVGLIIFNSFIKTFEKNQPTKVVQSVVEQLESTNARKYLEGYKDQINSFEDTSTILDDYVTNLNGKKLSFIENADYRADAPSYNITADGKNVAIVTLEKDSEGAFGLSNWKVKTLDISPYMPTSYSYNIMVPNDDTIYVNGKEVDASYITAVDEIPEAVKNVTQFVNDIPLFDTYTVKGLLNVPTVTAKKPDGSDASVAQSTDAFLVEGKPTDEFIQQQSPFVEAALKSWAYHFVNYGGSSNLANYVQSGSDLYAYIFGSDTMDPIYVAFYDWEYISNVTFNEFWYGNFMQYSPSCYSVDVKYQMTVDFNNGNPSDTDQALDATWIIVYNNGYWAIADLQYHTNVSSTTNTTSSTTDSTNK